MSFNDHNYSFNGVAKGEGEDQLRSNKNKKNVDLVQKN